MKKTFIVALAILCSYANSFAQSKAPKAVKTAFNLKFTNATKVKWDKENTTEYEASFLWKGVKHSANFGILGDWLETESPITFAKLPLKVQNSFNVEHKNSKIKAIAEIENSKGETVYEIEVKKGLSAIEYFYTSDGKSFKE